MSLLELRHLLRSSVDHLDLPTRMLDEVRCGRRRQHAVTSHAHLTLPTDQTKFTMFVQSHAVHYKLWNLVLHVTCREVKKRLHVNCTNDYNTATDYKIPRSERTAPSMNPSQMSSETEDSSGLGIFALCQEITSIGRHINKRRGGKATEEVE